QDLKRSGLSDETIATAQFFSSNDANGVARILGWSNSAKCLGACLGIPFFDPKTGEMIRSYLRFKPDKPRKSRKAEDKGKLIKYESPRGKPNRVYFPPAIISGLAD